MRIRTSATCCQRRISRQGPQYPTVATITQRDSEDEIVVDSDYSCWPPAPGEIDLSARVQTRPAPNGFLGASATFTDELSYPVIWVRGPPMSAMEGGDALQLEELSPQFHRRLAVSQDRLIVSSS